MEKEGLAVIFPFLAQFTVVLCKYPS